jgi:uroporphyrinogen decarboxylase
MPTSAKPLLRVLSGETLSPPPVWLMRQAGRYLPEYRAVRAKTRDFLELCFSPDLATEVTLQPIRRYGFDAAILFSDILVIPHALGQAVRFAEGEGPKLAPVRDVSDLKKLSVDRLRSGQTPLAAVYEAVAAIRDALPKNTALIGFAGAPWTVACYMVEGGTSREFHAVKQWAMGNADGFATLIDMIVDATIIHLKQQIAAGAEVIQLFDSHAGVLPDGAYERWVIEPNARIVSALRASYPAVPVIGFPRGSGPRYEAFVKATGVTAVSVDSAVPCDWAADRLQPQAVVQGNLDPVYLLAGGPAMRKATQSVLQRLGQGPMIFNLGHGVIKETPPDHVSDLVACIRGDGAR